MRRVGWEYPKPVRLSSGEWVVLIASISGASLLLWVCGYITYMIVRG